MRKRFEVSPILGSLPISEVVIPTKSRDELAPVLLALQTIFVSELYHQKMFPIVAPIILRDKNQSLPKSSYSEILKEYHFSYVGIL